MKKRLNEKISLDSISKYRSQLMGLAILWIIFFHSSIPAPESIIPRTLWYFFISFGGGVGVNVFLLLSGFGLNYAHASRKVYGANGEFGNYIKKRLLRILVPYFIVGILYYGVYDIIINQDIINFFKNLFFINFLQTGDRTYWYIFAILIYYLLFPALMWASDKFGVAKTHGITIGFIFILDCITCIAFPAFYAKFEIIILRTFSFVIGSFIGRCALNKKFSVNAVGCILVSFILIGLELILIRMGISSNRSSRYIFILLSIFLTLSISFLLEKLSLRFKILSKIGTYSLELYLIHIACANLPEKILKIFTDNRLPYIETIILIIISMALSWVVHIISQQIIKRFL